MLNGANNLVANGTFESGTNGWLFEGNHEELRWRRTVMAVPIPFIFGPAAEATPMQPRTDTLTGTIASGSTATLRAQARWLKGRPEVLLRLRGNWLEATGPLAVPPNLGTPASRTAARLPMPVRLFLM